MSNQFSDITIQKTDNYKLFYSSNLISNPRPFNSCINTLNDSGNPGSGIDSPLRLLRKF
jgi:hypothetical protein